MILEYCLPSRPVTRTSVVFTGETVTQETPPRIARLLALAHRLDGQIRDGKAKRFRELARAGGITPTRLSQILVLLALAPDIQETVLFLSNEGPVIREAELRTIAREPLWVRQRVMFAELIIHHQNSLNPADSICFFGASEGSM